MKLRWWNIEIDGPDKTGKTLLCQYITHLSNYRFATHARGYLTQVAYAKKFNRPFEYSMPNYRTLYVLLTCDKEEHDIRCKITNEPAINYDADAKLFAEAFDELDPLVYKKLTYNTSEISMYEIAKDIIWHADRLEDDVK